MPAARHLSLAFHSCPPIHPTRATLNPYPLPRPISMSPTPPSAEWSALLAAWNAGQDLEPALAAIRWDTPVVTWGTNALGTQVARLTHPLAVLVSLGDAQLADQAMAQVLDDRWDHQPGTLESPAVSVNQPAIEIPIPAMGDLWGWNVLPAALEAQAWSAAQRLLPRVAAGSQASPHQALAASALCCQLTAVQEVEPFMELWETLTQCPGLPERRFLAGQTFTHLALQGAPAVAAAFIGLENAGFVEIQALVHLAQRGHVDVALHAAEFAQVRNVINSNTAQEELWLHELDKALAGPLASRAAAHIAWLAQTQPGSNRALTHPSATQDIGRTGWSVVARALLACPEAFQDLFDCGQGPSQAVLVEWSRHVLPTDPRIDAWVERTGQSVSQHLKEQMLEAILKDEDKRAVSAKRSGKPGRADELLEFLVAWGQGLGMSAAETLAAVVPKEFRPRPPSWEPSPEWQAAQARREARVLDEALPEAVGRRGPGVRM